ncbi:MAG: hypothetical protein ABSB19_03505 [Methylomonas sp.]|jgi:hypothetical protein
MIFKTSLIIYFSLLVASQPVSASLWLPSAPNAEVSTVTFSGSSMRNAEIGIFNAETKNLSDKPVASFNGNAKVTFVHNGKNWDVSVDGKTSTQLNSNLFQLAWLSNGAWIPEVDVTPSKITPNLWELTFLDSEHGSAKETVSVANIEPAPQASESVESIVSAVPLSATAWAFLSGLIGSLAISKRRNAGQ